MYLTFLHIVVKILYTVNVIGQFFLLNACLSSGYHLWGLQVLNDLIHGREWEETGYFPRVTLCDFQVRTLGNLHYYTIQCVLMINMFNEKIFVFLWWWFFLVATATICSLLYSVFIYFSRKQQMQFVSRYLRITDCLLDFSDEGRKEVAKFFDYFLRSDGVFILRMISWHGGDLITTEIIYFMWNSFTNNDVKAQLKLRREPARSRSDGTYLEETAGLLTNGNVDKHDEPVVALKRCANHLPNYFSANLLHYLNKRN
ncbi:unnamed protein product [Soboliphyme baturini]|uniref:Innexin n=1 Tax=Soboliphyme baturini TaxID=241478 RepID=A0A183ILI8_9BILA|nr:unnamed protein product [Soboliphyme baturini]